MQNNPVVYAVGQILMSCDEIQLSVEAEKLI